MLLSAPLDSNFHPVLLCLLILFYVLTYVIRVHIMYVFSGGTSLSLCLLEYTFYPIAGLFTSMRTAPVCPSNFVTYTFIMRHDASLLCAKGAGQLS
jgi:hypothetical protein